MNLRVGQNYRKPLHHKLRRDAAAPKAAAADE